MFESVKPEVIANQLRKARKTAGLTQRDVSEKLDIPKERIDSWEKGKEIPSVEDLWVLSDLYGRSTDYFLLELPAMPESLSFRMKAVHILEELPQSAKQIFIRFEELCRAEYELEKALGITKQVYFKRNGGDDPYQLASSERYRLELNDYPVKDLRQLLVSQGIRVFILPIPEFKPVDLAGVSWWHETYGPCMLINGKNVPGRRTFTMAHEYAHLLHSDPPTVCAYMVDHPEERFADFFAKDFLMPSSGVLRIFRNRRYMSTSITDQELGSIANTFGVSLEAISIRLEELGLVPEGFTNLNIERWEKKPKFYRGSRGPRWRRQLGEDFVQLAGNAYHRGFVSANRLAKYFGIDIRETLNTMREIKQK